MFEVRGFAAERQGGFRVAIPELALGAGEVLALYGPSGGGKTTMLRAMFGLGDRGLATRGDVRFRGEELLAASAPARRHLLRHGIVFLAQDAQSALDPLQAVGRQIEQATECRPAEAVAMLAELGIDDAAALARRLPHAISGGQAQRVLLAIAFLRRPALVVADEPSASLDGGSYAELLARLRALLSGDRAVLLATHDHRLLGDLAARVHVLVDGAFVPAAAEAAPWPGRAGDSGIGSAALLSARGLCVRYGARVVLDRVDFTLRRGEVVAIVGESGAGKTTLARVLAGHLAPDAGTIDTPPRRTALQLCCQDASSSLTPGRPIRSLLAEAANPFFDAEVVARDLRLDPAALDRPVERLSGGERRRVSLLRALSVHPDVLILDEPTASLDRLAAIAVLEAVYAQQRLRGLALVLVTHDLDLANAVADRVLTVVDGRLE
ncbi:MAG: ATP-binding cassette domain-containing protein [Planctomycetota bacterium]